MARWVPGFLAAVLIVASSTFATDTCTFKPCESAQRVVDMRNLYNRLRLFADTSLSHQDPQAPAANVLMYPAVTGIASDEDVVCLKLLVHPKGTVLDAKIKRDGRFDESHCLAFQWAAATEFVPATVEDESVAGWLTTDVHVVYGPDSVRVWAASEVPDTDSAAADDADLPAMDEFVPVDKMAEMIESAAPDYPEAEKQAGHKGVVWLRCLVDKTGAVRKAVVYKTSGYPALDSAAVNISPQNRFKPAELNGQPTAMWVTYKVNFE